MSPADDYGKPLDATKHVEAVLNDALETPRSRQAQVVPLRPGDWPAPESLVEPDSRPTEFPVSALGPMQEVTEEIQKHVKCPVALAASSVLSAASLAAQGCFDVAFRGQDARPLSSFMITIGRSGERKSTADRLANIGVQRRVKSLRQQAETDRKRNELEAGEPFPILSPELITGSGTVEGLIQGFSEGHPSQGLMSDEAGQILGGHSLKAENKLHGMAMLSKLHEGGTITKKIKGRGPKTETTTLTDCRLTVHLLGQRVAILPFLKDPVARGQGILARVNIHEPATTAGTRQTTLAEWQENAVSQPVLEFADRIEELLSKSVARNSEGDVERPVLEMEDCATSLLVDFFNSIETRIAPAGDLAGLSDLCNKTHETAARFAGVLAVFRGEQIISADSMQSGIEIAEYFLAELTRLSGTVPAAEDLENACKMARWLKKEGRATKIRTLSRRGPKSCRQKEAREGALKLLKNADWVRETAGLIELNPKLTDSDLNIKGQSK
ncbi:MAG: DUF3987 domain-containing protein [Pseudomonadota bacterium]